MESRRVISRIVSPILSGLNHVFFRPITIKYPFERAYNVPDSNYRFDPKEGVAYPGYRGRHILYLDRCTGCASCDRACENIAEAITMVYGFDVSLKMDNNVYAKLEQDRDISLALEYVMEPFRGELKTVEKKDDYAIIRMNSDPIFEYRCEALFENLLDGAIYRIRKMGGRVELSEHKPAEGMKFKIDVGPHQLELAIEKRDMGFKQNRRSVFPAVDYGRCVFCGLCVDACPFNSLEMGPSYELSSLEREELFYNPFMLARRFFETCSPETVWSEKAVMVLRRYR